MKKIRFATDFSERSDRALRRAVIPARAHDAVQEILHVVDDDRPRRIVDHEVEDARRLLSALARSLKDLDGVSCSTQTGQDDPFSGIIAAVAKATPDLLVIGPHRRPSKRAIARMVPGSVALQVLKDAKYDVLAIPPRRPDWRYAGCKSSTLQLSKENTPCMIALPTSP